MENPIKSDWWKMDNRLFAIKKDLTVVKKMYDQALTCFMVDAWHYLKVCVLVIRPIIFPLKE